MKETDRNRDIRELVPGHRAGKGREPGSGCLGSTWQDFSTNDHTVRPLIPRKKKTASCAES